MFTTRALPTMNQVSLMTTTVFTLDISQVVTSVNDMHWPSALTSDSRRPTASRKIRFVSSVTDLPVAVSKQYSAWPFFHFSGTFLISAWAGGGGGGEE